MRAGRICIAAALVAFAATVVACSKNGASSADIDRLRAAAHLTPCPATSGPSLGHIPDHTLACLGTGPSVRVAAVRGPLLLNVWGSWCGPCQREVPALQEVYDAAHGRLRVLGVDTEDSHASALDFAAHAHMTYPSVVDDDGAFLHAFGRSATPMTLFIDGQGNVVHTQYGQFKSTEDIHAAVQRWLGVQL